MKQGLLKYTKAIALATALSFCSAQMVHAQSCATDVSSAQNDVRKSYIEGMNGVASNNFSSRPGTYAEMSCLDNFMKGNLDIFFKPPNLNDLLNLALNFACQKAKQAIGQALGGAGGGGGGGINLQQMLGSMAGGLILPSGGSSPINLNSVLGNSGSAIDIQSLKGLFK